MAGVRQEAGEPQARGAGDAARDVEGGRAQRIDAAAVIAAIDLDEHADPQPARPCRGGEPFGDVAVVGEDIEAKAGGDEVERGGELPGLDGHGVGDVAEAVRGERGGLGQRGHRDGAIVPARLDARDLHRLVRLDVRPETNAERACPLAHPRGVLAEAGHVEDERRSGEPVKVHHGQMIDDRRCRRTDERPDGSGIPIPPGLTVGGVDETRTRWRLVRDAARPRRRVEPD